MSEFLDDLITECRSLFPLFRYLLLQTETHAFCLALACAALIGFYPICFLLLSVTLNVFHWQGAHDVVEHAIRIYYPTSQDWLIRNLEVSVKVSGRTLKVGSIFWVFLGAAGVFIPLEAALNRLWKVTEDRSYWRNQIVGLTLTIACVVLALFFVAIDASIQALTHWPLGWLQKISDVFAVIQSVSDHIIIQANAVCFFSTAIFLFYKFLPNRHVDTIQVLPAAILAGIGAEVVKDIYVFVLPFMDIGNNQGSQGPFNVSVSFVLLAYFETFVVLGGAFLATQTEAYPWMGFIHRRRRANQ